MNLILGFPVLTQLLTSFNTMVRSLFLIPFAATIVSAATLAERQSTCACGYKDSTGAIWVSISTRVIIVRS